MTAAILKAMDKEKRRLDEIENQPVGHMQRLLFSISATRRSHQRLEAAISTSPEIEKVLTFRDTEDE
jgi:hypothetical protein